MEILNPTILTVCILEDLQEALALWANLSKDSAQTVYQTPEFLYSWFEIVGQDLNLEPLFIVITDEFGGQLLLPLCIKKIGILKIAQFLGGKHANFNMPIFNDGALKWKMAQIKSAVIKAGKLSNIDVFSFKNQPLYWQSIKNPFSELWSQPSPSFGYGLTLMNDPNVLISERLSKEGRKKLRQKENGVTKLGNVQFLEAENPEQHDTMLNAYFTQKSVQFKDKGIVDPFDSETVREWIGTLKGLRLFGLELDNKYLAIWGIGEQGRHASGMFTSYDIQSEAARSSPGEVLLVWLIRKLCTDGYASVDFGVGEARYKDTWCDTTIELVDTHIGTNVTGRAVASIMRLKGNLKRRTKQSSFVFGFIKRVKTKFKLR